jgi:hypothetical protein
VLSACGSDGADAPDVAGGGTNIPGFGHIPGQVIHTLQLQLDSVRVIGADAAADYDLLDSPVEGATVYLYE